jgi:hypothetical protein
LGASVRCVLRRTPPRIDGEPHLGQRPQGREQRFHLLWGVGQEEGFDGMQSAPEPDLPEDRLQALGRTVNLSQQDDCASSSSVRWSACAMAVHCFDVMGRFPRSMSEI